MTSLSLPSLAYRAMFSSYPDNQPLSYSPSDDDLRQLYRDSTIGGLTTVAHRQICLSDESDEKMNAPEAAIYAPNGKKYTYCCFLDFNSMYLHSQLQGK